jgi:serine/threonine protein kinase
MAPALDLTGSVLDRRYRITRLLGEGGMGHVYEALHVVLDQLVAVKVLHPRYAYEERFRERFLQEARAASRIQHPNVVVIKDFGDTPDGSVYFVMEYLQGCDLGAELQAHGAMPWARARRILLQAASALHAAHTCHIIHRDIKPANCFLTRDEHTGGFDMVKLVDFGIAKVGGESHAEGQDRKLTGTGEVFGTASYMAPEHARGEVLDARSDVYSLGIMAYEMLAGRVPFTGGNSIHVITRHLSEAPRPLRSHDPEIPEEVDALVLRMLAKEPRDRFGSMAAVEEGLLAIAVDARRTSSPEASRATVVPTRDPAVEAMPATTVEPKPPAEPDADREPRSEASSVPTMIATGEPEVEATPVRTMIATGEPEVEATPVRTLIATGEPDATAGRPSSPMPPAIAQDAEAAAPSLLTTVRASAPIEVVHHASGPQQGHRPTTGAGSGVPSRELDGRSHSLEIRLPVERSGRFALVAGLLLLLVGGGAALVTKAVLSDREGSAEGEPKSSAVVELADAEVGAARGATADERAGARNEASVPAENAARGLDGGAARAGAPAVEDEPPAQVREAGAGEPPQGGTAPSGPEIADARPDAVAPPRADEDAAAPKVAEHETEKCAAVRKRAGAALDGRDWTTLHAQARQKRCWSAAAQTERRRLDVRALLELGRFGECVKAGGRASDAATKSMVETCRKRAG